MKVLDLFSGIGGFSLGLERAGMSTVAMCEKDPYCRKILAKHWPDLTIHEDIRNLDGKRYAESIDLVCGGFPCQPFSVAGKRKGTNDDRHLWPEMLRVIQESRPRWVIGENVFGFINMALDDVQADLEREHYEVRKFVLPAVAVDAKHRRDRIILIAYSNSPAVWDRTERQAQGRDNLQAGRKTITPNDGTAQSLADTQSERVQGLRSGREQEPHAHERQELPMCESQRPRPAYWEAEPCVGRVADGVPNRVDRIRGLGNAVVPQLIQAIGELVIEADKEMRSGR
tara:strand:+ start:293 stop:1147 length:855 start_codon:yes stop_codon:yes gene_type:complete